MDSKYSDFSSVDDEQINNENFSYKNGEDKSTEKIPKDLSLFQNTVKLLNFSSEITSDRHHENEIFDNFSDNFNEGITPSDKKKKPNVKLEAGKSTVITSPKSKFSKLIEKVISMKNTSNQNKKPLQSLSINSTTSEEETKSNKSDGTQSLPDDVRSLSYITKWWQKYSEIRKFKRTKAAKIEENKMRYKLQYHFMSPFEKYKLGRKPWKLGIQVLKIIMVTAQVILFGTDRFASVAFMKNTQNAFKNLFIKSYDGTTPFSIFNKHDLIEAIAYTNETYYNLMEISIGKFRYAGFVEKNPSPILICLKQYQYANGNMSRGIDQDAATTEDCVEMYSKSILSFKLHQNGFFDSVVSIHLKFNLSVIFWNGLKLRHVPECFEMQNNIVFDNSHHDGQLRINLEMSEDILNCPEKFVILGEDNKIVQDLLITFDILVILICTLSCLLCIRSLVKSMMLAEAAQKYFATYKSENLTKWDVLELINKWFAVIVISDLLSIIGSVYKIRVDERDIRFYNICSVLLGLGVVLVWIGILRFFTYLKSFNILLIALRYAAPNLMRFMFCAMFIFTGFTLCGWIVMGPYHAKFQTFLSTAEGLFSLLNGDDIYATFLFMSPLNSSVWVFSKIYLYTFVSLFIYIVLSTFISIVGDTYERLKDWGRMPPTRIEVFIMGRSTSGNSNEAFTPTCSRCIRAYSVAGHDLVMNLTNESLETLSSRRLSVVSASIE
nr:mucolipin-3-like [Hydra vulgaris]